MSISPAVVKIPSLTPSWNLDAWKYLPALSASKPPPVIVMAHGFGANKLLSLREYAEHFVSLGYAVIVFDYRRWGASDGSPRNVLIVSEQLDDYRTVIKWCRQQPDFDPHRVVVWGSSFSGGHITQIASEDSGLAAAMGQCPFSNGIASLFLLPIMDFLRILPWAILDVVKQGLGFQPVYLLNASPPGGGGILTAPGTVESFYALAKHREDYPNQIAASAVFQVPFYCPNVNAKNIACPFLLSISTDDLLCPPEGAIRAVEMAPKGEMFRCEGGHFDCYPGQKEYQKSLMKQSEFLAKHVPI